MNEKSLFARNPQKGIGLGCLTLGALFSLVLGQSAASASTDVRMPRLESLEKLTVGPDNHFQVAITPSEDRIFFTRSTNLATRLFSRGLKDSRALGQVEPFVKAEFDTKDPALSPDGARIAFTSFESQARGDVCVQRVNAEKTAEAICAGEKSASEQPFWLGNQKIGYIRRPTGSNKAQIMSFDLASKEKRTILEDQILSAHADSSVRWIVYSSVQGVAAREDSIKRVLKVFRVSDGQSWPLKLALPGLPGFPRFDEKNEFVYFAQFSNDTNGDSKIDGNDNAVLYRMRTADLEEKSVSILPEQLTTAEQNCNFPAPGRDSLYMACAFEGALDVYRIPKTGLVPTQWSEKNLLDAYRTSRNIAERTLIINTLRYRFEAYRNSASLEKVLSQHILTGEYEAALHYLDFVEAAAPAAEKTGYALLRHLLEVLQYRARERLDQISPEFIALLAEKRRIFDKEKGAYRSFAQLATGFVELSLRKNLDAKNRLASVQLTFLRSSLEHYIYLNLAKSLFEQNAIPVQSWIDAVVRVSEQGVVSTESSSYLSAQILQKLAELHKSAADRSRAIGELRKKTKPGGVFDLVLSSQEFLLSVAKSTSEAEEDKWFAEFNKLLAKIDDQYFLKRVVSIQGVLTLAEFNKTRVMAYIDSNWLRSAKLSDTEYMLARDQYVSVVLDEAYSYWSQGKIKFASQVFYSSVRLTDDQESHLGFVTTLLEENNRKLLDERYASLKSASFSGANLDFAQAALALYDDLNRKEFADTKLLEDAEKRLNALKDDGSRPAGKHLLLGYIAHQKMLRAMKGFTFDQELSQQAHHQYMIALDLARKSVRMSSRILSNLGALHFQTGNFGMASGFFAAREKYGFENDNSRLAFLANFSKALYRNGEFPRAFTISTQGLELARKSLKDKEILNGWLEKTAFYASQASRFAEAATLYQQYLQANSQKEDENMLKVRLMTGWSLMRAGERKRATEHFDKLLNLADKLKSRKAQGVPGDVIDFHPDRYKALAYGFLTQVSAAPAARIPLRAERMKIVTSWKKELKSYALSEENWMRFVLKDCSAQATDLWLSGDVAASKTQLEKCLSTAADFAEDGGEPGDEQILETLRASWMLSHRYAEKKVALSGKGLEQYLSLSRRALSKLDALAGASRPMANRWLKLRAENLAARHIFLSAGQRDFISKPDLESELSKHASSERIELLSGEEREEFSRQMGLLRSRVANLVRGEMNR